MIKKPINKFFYGIVTNTQGFKNYIGCDANSGGYPFLSPYPVIFHDTKFLEDCKNSKYIASLAEDENYKLTIFQVDPEYNTMYEWGGFCKLEKIN